MRHENDEFDAFNAFELVTEYQAIQACSSRQCDTPLEQTPWPPTQLTCEPPSNCKQGGMRHDHVAGASQVQANVQAKHKSNIYMHRNESKPKRVVRARGMKGCTGTLGIAYRKDTDRPGKNEHCRDVLGVFVGIPARRDCCNQNQQA